jgi:bifunctional DNA-binding transcriptional regulator/antitoxin component of YhaV-PrlF toxin-antitoxin module
VKEDVIDLGEATVTSNLQIQVLKTVRKLLKLGKGDRVRFLLDGEKRIWIEKAANDK